METLKRIGEHPNRLSEPDVMLDFGEAGLIVIEVKLHSPNDQQEANARWDKYLSNASLLTPAFKDVHAARKSGCYELVRNWRIGCGLARDRAFALINLIPNRLLQDRSNRRHVEQFVQSIAEQQNRIFVELTWERFIDTIDSPEEWFKDYCRERLRYVIHT